ncbi:EscV/YscV/HrcV family type III secretion system export apparatus protein [Xenophilus aerolatus]|nr:EscV/YscV/HrcV family type III secretion system export apparatus protein [Xenophilus aerolatus]
MSAAPADTSMLQHLWSKGSRAEVATAGIVMAIVIAMILPLPVWLLDTLLAINISASALLIVLVIQVKDIIGLSTFPTLVLITTLMRLALEVASTRLILLEGYAGHIIEAFAQVVVGGNIVVGFVVFLILTLVQFIVITKGSERVAEVGARFTLDAMPGKQMAIDMELRANTITPEQAREQRAMLAQESQFFGAMDGAMKFVKGDAIAGIVIMLVNLIGGLGVGILQRGMSASEAMHTYSMLTIGDGLVTQVPALLTSLTAGLLVTKTGGVGENASNLGHKLADQLAAQPKAWVTASALIGTLGLIPGMPLIVFAAVAAFALGFGLHLIQGKRTAARAELSARRGLLQDVREFELVSPLSLRISARLRDHSDKLRLINATRSVRNAIVVSYGMMLPQLDIEPMASDTSFDVALCQNDVALVQLRVPQEASMPPEWWASYELQMREALLRAAPRTFGVQEAQHLFDWIAKLHPQLHKELERVVPVGRFAEIVQRLISEQISVRNLKLIAQALVEAGPRERDPALLAEQVRQALSREICAAYAEHGVLSAFMLETELEDAIRDAIRPTSHGQLLTFDSDRAEPILNQMEALLRNARLPAPVLLCSEDIRPFVRRIFSARFFLVPVLALGEATAHCRFEIKGVLELHPQRRAQVLTAEEPAMHATTAASTSHG